VNKYLHTVASVGFLFTSVLTVYVCMLKQPNNGYKNNEFMSFSYQSEILNQKGLRVNVRHYLAEHFNMFLSLACCWHPWCGTPVPVHNC